VLAKPAFLVAVAAGIAVPVAAAVPRAVPVPIAGGSGSTATLSNSSAGAQPVAVTIRFRAELQCGRLNAPVVVVRLPSAMHVPSAIGRARVLVSGKEPSSVTVSGVAITIKPARPKPGTVICDVIGPGTVSVAFAAGAGLGNPATAGSYAFSVSAARQTWRGKMTIH
jgi:hypothetical protein